MLAIFENLDEDAEISIFCKSQDYEIEDYAHHIYVEHNSKNELIFVAEF